MERVEGSFRFELPEPSAIEIRLAEALAERLDAVVPSGFRVRAYQGLVCLYHGSEFHGCNGVVGVLDHNSDVIARSVARAAVAVLSGIQDEVAHVTKDPWPRLPQGGMAMPGARLNGDQVLLWYGPQHDSEIEAVISLSPIDLEALVRQREAGT